MMQTTPDDQLLGRYVREGSETAFAEILRRHVNFVYSVCRRELGDSGLAEDAAQVVFLVLARKAASIRSRSSLTHWLFETARLTCKDLRRREAIRRRQEQVLREEAAMQAQTQDLWHDIEPVINDALAALGGKDREAVLLRYFQRLSLRETGDALSISEDAARKRVDRALLKLRRSLGKQGVTVGAAALAVLVAEHGTQASQSFLLAVVMKTALGGAGTVGAGTGGTGLYQITQGVIRQMMVTKIQTGAALLGIALFSGAGLHAIAGSHGGNHTRSKPPVLSAASKTAAAALSPTPGSDGKPLILRMVQAYKDLNSFSETIEQDITRNGGSQIHVEALIAMQRPDRIAVRIKSLSPNSAGSQVVIDGTKVYEFVKKIPDQYLKYVLYENEGQFETINSVLGTAGGSTALLRLPHSSSASIGGIYQVRWTVGKPVMFDGTLVNVVQTYVTEHGSDSTEHGSDSTMEIGIGASDNLIRYIKIDDRTAASGHMHLFERHRDVKANLALTDDDFKFTPPPGAKEVDNRNFVRTP